MPRQTNHQRRLIALCAEIEEEIRRAAQAELSWLFRQVQMKIRRINQFRPKTRGMAKAEVMVPDMWDLFRERMRQSLMREIMSGAIKLFALNQVLFEDKTYEFDTNAIARSLELEIGERITKVTTSIKREVGQKISAWYNTPATTMQSVINQLRPRFGEYRSKLIAQTEITNLDSRVKEETAVQVGVTEWWWNTRNDQLVCTKPLKGPDGKIYKGCRQLHGKKFKIGQPMPPDGSHVGCRCSAILIVPLTSPRALKWLPGASFQDDMLQKQEFDENKHPRRADGKFAPKGQGEAGVGEKTTPTPDATKPTSIKNLVIPDEIKHHIQDLYEKGSYAPKAYHDLADSSTLGLADLVAGQAGFIKKENPPLDDQYHYFENSLDDMYYADENQRHGAKSNLVEDIAKKSGLSNNTISAAIKGWAETSNKSEAASNMQVAVSEIFGCEMSEFQKDIAERFKKAYLTPDEKKEIMEAAHPFIDKRVKKLETIYEKFKKESKFYIEILGDLENRKAFISRAPEYFQFSLDEREPPLFTGQLDKLNALNTNPMPKAIKESEHEFIYGDLISEKYKGFDDYVNNLEPWHGDHYIPLDDCKKIIKAMYQNTQEKLADAGYKPDDEITLFRGGQSKFGIPAGSILKEVTIHGNAAESWAMNPVVARNFGDTVLMTKIPVKNILSTCTTGFGCLPESEVVALGGKIEAIVVASPYKRPEVLYPDAAPHSTGFDPKNYSAQGQVLDKFENMGYSDLSLATLNGYLKNESQKIKNYLATQATGTTLFKYYIAKTKNTEFIIPNDPDLELADKIKGLISSDTGKLDTLMANHLNGLTETELKTILAFSDKEFTAWRLSTSKKLKETEADINSYIEAASKTITKTSEAKKQAKEKLTSLGILTPEQLTFYEDKFNSAPSYIEWVNDKGTTENVLANLSINYPEMVTAEQWKMIEEIEDKKHQAKQEKNNV